MNEPTKKAEINILTTQDTTGPGFYISQVNPLATLLKQPWFGFLFFLVNSTMSGSKDELSSIFTGYLFLNEWNSRFFYLPSKLCISNLQPTFKTLSPATYLLDHFGHPLCSVWILLALTLRTIDLEHSLSQPPNFGANYLTTYAHARI